MTDSCVLAVNQVDNHLNHDLPLVGLALGNQQGKRDQRIVGDALFSHGVIQKIVAAIPSPLQGEDQDGGGSGEMYTFLPPP